MMRRPAADFDDVFGKTAEEPAVTDEVDEVDEADVVDRVALDEATQLVARAAGLVDAAVRAHRAAEDHLADTEGAVSVLEFKLADVEAKHVDDQAGAGTAGAWPVAEVREELAAARRRYASAGQDLGAAETRVAAAQAQLSVVEQAHERAQTASAAAEPEAEVPAPRFASLPLFVEQFVLPNWVHHLGENYAGRWCRQWWEHAEALTRLEAVWEAFEVMRREPAPSFSTWLRDHLDSHMRGLTDPNGVFYRCDAEKNVHEAAAAWPSQPAPAEMFAVIPGALIQPESASDVGAVEQLLVTRPAATPVTPTRAREMQHG